MRDLLGGKGAGLAEMTNLGLPVPPGFTITTRACNAYFDSDRQFPEGLWDQTLEAVKNLEEKLGKRFGEAKNPLLLSVRSGAKFSMPGMMDTVLNLGLNDEIVEVFAKLVGDERFAFDAYRRLLQMFADVVLGVDGSLFEKVLRETRTRLGVQSDSEIPPEEIKKVVASFKEIVERETGSPFPQEPLEQLRLAVRAVFESWFGKRAVDYREHNKIAHDLGTGVNVQAMVFGNLGEDSASGVAFTRNPSTGEKALYGEYLRKAQGEDVVAGIRTPHPIADLEGEFPEAYSELAEIANRLELHYREMQDIEFTIENGKLWMLQTRAGKRTSHAAVVIAVDMAGEGLIKKEDAVRRVTPTQVEQLLHPRFETDSIAKAESEGRQITEGLNASPGAAVGKAVFDADTAVERGDESVILVRPETTPDDVHGFLKSKGILTQHGGMTSHAAIVARGLGIPAVVGCEEIQIDLESKKFSVDGKVINEGDLISIDGSSGRVYTGEIESVVPNLAEEKELTELLGWADEFRDLGVRANADYGPDARRAREFGAEGIGLCRTEHMFFESERLPIVRRMIMARTVDARREALSELLPMQRGDFEKLLREMEGLPVIIRLIDPPLHEFLPSREDLIVEITKLRISKEDPQRLQEREKLLRAVEDLHEENPMLGFRGVRLGILYPEIVEMQARAILEAASKLVGEGIEVKPAIMVPLVAHGKELRMTRERLEEVAKQVMAEKGQQIEYKIGTMIELPRACIVADKLAEPAQFFSFGTNDLTQMTFGISRDDAEGKFLGQYSELGLLEDPFASLDIAGVGELMRIAVEKARKTRPDLEIGICGEHGGDPASIDFAHQIELNYVSCSPFRVPVARLAAAQAALGASAEADV